MNRTAEVWAKVSALNEITFSVCASFGTCSSCGAMTKYRCFCEPTCLGCHSMLLNTLKRVGRAA